MTRIQTYGGRIRLVGGRIRKACCCNIQPGLPGCECLPLTWGAAISDLPAKTFAGQGMTHTFSWTCGTTLFADPDSRIFCRQATGSCAWLFGGYDYSYSNGNYSIPYTSNVSGFVTYSITAGTTFYRRRWVGGLTPDFTGATFYQAADTDSGPPDARSYMNFSITIDDACGVGPGDVTINASLRERGTPLPFVVQSWVKTITLGTGECLKDYGSISMDPITGNYYGAPIGAIGSPGPGCDGLNSSVPYDDYASLVLTPNG